MGLQLRHHFVNGGGRDREADADAAAGGREDHRIHSDDLSAQVERRPAGIAAVDGSVDLDEVRIRTITHIATDGGDDARGHRIGQAERIADGHHPVAHPKLAVVAEFDGGKRLVAFHLDERHIGGGVSADQLGIELAAIRQLHGNLGTVIDDVVVGDDVARLVDDEAGSDADGFLRHPALAKALEELAEGFRYVLGQLLGGLAGSGSDSTVTLTTAGLTRSTRSAKLKAAPFSSIRGGWKWALEGVAAAKIGPAVGMAWRA